MTDLQVWLEAVIKEYDESLSVNRVISTEEKDLLNVGENYLSQVKKLTVRAVRGDGQIVTESFILKRLPVGIHTRQYVLGHGLNFTELTAYRDVLPAMDLLLKEKGVTDEPIWPKCLSAKCFEKILFEDLTAKGYKMLDRFKGLDLEHCTLVVQNLGLFHSLSLVLKDQGAAPHVVYDEYYALRNREPFELLIYAGYKHLLADMEKWGEAWQPALKKLKANLSGYGDKICDLLKPQEKGFTVLNHGDCWTNNILFKYNAYSGKPILMRFLDFQASFYGSPAQDLLFFLTISPNLDVRRRHCKDLVRIYHQSLLFNMNRLGVKETPPTLEYIESEMKRLTYLRFYRMTTMLALILRKPEETRTLEEMLEKAKGWAIDVDDNLRTIYQLAVKQAEDEGTL